VYRLALNELVRYLPPLKGTTHREFAGKMSGRSMEKTKQLIQGG
jgi:hypothetical protein